MTWRRHDRASRAAVVALIVALALSACSSTSTPVTSASGTAPSPSTRATTSPTPPTTAADPRFAGFAPCPEQPFQGSPQPDQRWICKTIQVPLDRASPAAGTIPLAIFALPHTDRSAAAAEPMFTTPGGPGRARWQNGDLWELHDAMIVHHDIITVDPRGTGMSGAINCAEFQAKPSWGAIPLCGAYLGAASDRYGAGDRALDLDQVRQLLGYDTIDYVGQSAASIDIQAYAHRFPEHLRAVVTDGGYTVLATPPDYRDFFGSGQPQALVEMAALVCGRDATCHAQDADPVKTLTDLLARVRAKPVGAVDEVAVIRLLEDADLAPVVEAADALRDGNRLPLEDMASPGTPDQPDAFDYNSQGDFLAAGCNDGDAPWKRSDPITVRKQKLAAALDALPADVFAPFSKKAWTTTNPPGICISWPAPLRFEPVSPPGSPKIDVPALLLSGDLDRNAQTLLSRLQTGLFSHATFLVVKGAGHPTMTGIMTDVTAACASGIASHFLETLEVGDTSCASTPP